MKRKEIRVAHPRPGAETRRALVEAAFAQLAAAGFEGLRTRDVAAVAGVNVATLHYHFPTKEDLIAGVVGHAMSRFSSTLAGEGSPREQLRAHLGGVRRLVRSEPALLRVMGELAARSARDPAIAEMMKRSDSAWHAWLTRLVEAAANDGDPHLSGEPGAIAALVMATLRGLFMLPTESRRQERTDQALDQLEAFLGL